MSTRARANFPSGCCLGLLSMLLTSSCGQGIDDTSAPPAQQQTGTTFHPDEHGVIHVYAGQPIQHALDAAAQAGVRTVRVHEGVYRPATPGHAMLWFNARHRGITVEAEGTVVLTASHLELADRDSPAFPAIVNHVVYFGDGVTRSTVLRGFHITGANGYMDDSELPARIEPAQDLARGLFLYSDGGAIKIFGRSYPTLLDLEISGNTTQLCGAGISVEHQGHKQSEVLIRDCVFRHNRCPATGPAVDLLEGSAATIENCLFVANVGNYGLDEVKRKWGITYKPDTGCGALTVFPNSRAIVRRCTFTENANGVDDASQGNVYEDCIFWHNTKGDDAQLGSTYEIDILDARNVRNCFVGGERPDLRGTINAESNRLAAPDPRFDQHFVPQADQYGGIGFRPVASHSNRVGHGTTTDE